MIINIRGTSGSGKSTLVRRVRELYNGATLRFKEPGRKQPIGYVHYRNQGRSLAIIGHYETPCGGCDTISKMEDIFGRVREAHDLGHDVIFEGLLISADVNRTAALHQEGYPLLVVGMDVPLDECLASVNKRRWAKNPEKPGVNPKNTASKFKGVQQSMERLATLGVTTAWHTRDGALARIRQELGL